MKLITEAQKAKLLENGKRQKSVAGTAQELDLRPVVKLFRGDGACKWLLTELDPDDPDLAFGLCDLGLGMPELGFVRISEIRQCGMEPAFPIERDKFFKAKKPISQYAEDASHRNYINA